MLLIPVHRYVVGDFIHSTIDSNADISRFRNINKFLFVFTLAAPYNWSQNLQLSAFRKGLDDVDDLVGALPLDRTVTIDAIRNSDSGEEDSKIVVSLGYGANCRARIFGGALLIDGDRG